MDNTKNIEISHKNFNDDSTPEATPDSPGIKNNESSKIQFNHKHCGSKKKPKAPE